MTQAEPTSNPESPPLKPPLPKRKAPDFKTVLALIVGILILFMAFSMLNINDISKVYIEKVASNTLNTPVRMGKMDINLEERRITVENLLVSNPEGFTKGWALGAGAIDIVVESGTPEQLVLKEINVRDGRVTLEVQNDRTNLTTIHKGMNRLAAADNGGEKDKPAKPPIVVIIQSLKLNDAHLLPYVGGTDVNAIAFPPLQLNGIGQETGGVLVSQAIAQIMDFITQQAIAQAATEDLLSSMSEESFQEIKTSLGLDFLSRARATINQLGESFQQSIGRRR